MHKGSLFGWRTYLNWGLKDCSCLSKEERKKARQAFIYVGRGDHEDQSFSFRWSLSPWEGGFPMLSPPSSAPCHCTMTSHRVSDTLTWGFPEAFSQLLGQWPAFCQLLCVWLLANHFPSLGWSYFIHKTVEGKWLWLYMSVTMLETIELYTSSRWVIWYVNYISKSCCLFVCFHCSVLGDGAVLPKGWKAVAIKALLLYSQVTLVLFFSPLYLSEPHFPHCKREMLTMFRWLRNRYNLGLES